MLGLVRRLRKAGVVGINARNRRYIMHHNPRALYELVDDKVQTKRLAMQANIAVPKLYGLIRTVHDARDFQKVIEGINDFVIKPAHGSGGNGIIVIVGRKGDDWVGISGKIYTVFDLRKHISDIIFGIYSFDLGDRAIIESRILQHAEMTELSPLGLADVRIIMCDEKPVMSMTRVPTRQSDGKANLHQGALGVAIDIASGITTHAQFLGQPIAKHPDTGIAVLGRRLPFWTEVIELAEPDAPVSEGMCSADGRIRDVVYLGMHTRYVVELELGGELTVVEQNLNTTSMGALAARGRRVRLLWSKAHNQTIVVSR